MPNKTGDTNPVFPIRPEKVDQRTDPQNTAGIFKLFIGYAPGVGKTFSMLSEGIRRRQRGEDVVIAFVETHGRRPIAELAQKLETVPPRRVEVNGAVFEEMDLDGVLTRRPQVALVDELPHSNLKGSLHEKRYEDVMEILKAGISVISTVNIQHIESLRPAVKRMTGVAVRECIPDWVLQRADEVVVTDVTPEALRMRLRRGDIYPGGNPESALNNFFRRENLIGLRELALNEVARVVNRKIEPLTSGQEKSCRYHLHEVIVVCIDSRPPGRDLIGCGAQLAASLDGDLYVVHVRTGKEDAENDRVLKANQQFARDLNAEVVELESNDIARAVGEFAQAHAATQIILGRSADRQDNGLFYWRRVRRVLHWAPFVDLHLVSLQRSNSRVNR
jgi:two-component system, OmpR family, sensor histidine kinase KdpD